MAQQDREVLEQAVKVLRAKPDQTPAERIVYRVLTRQLDAYGDSVTVAQVRENLADLALESLSVRAQLETQMLIYAERQRVLADFK